MTPARSRWLRITLFVVGALIASITLALAHPRSTWFGVACALAGAAAIVTLLAIANRRMRVVATVASIVAAGAIVPANALSIAGIVVYVLGMFLLAPAAHLLEIRDPE